LQSAVEEEEHGDWLPLSAQYPAPGQQWTAVEQGCPVNTHAGVSQKQAVPEHGALLDSGAPPEQQKLPLSPPQPAWHVKPMPQSVGTEQGTGSSVKHCRSVQQLASLVHDCESPEHVGGGGPQTPLLHTSVALQQGIVSEQAWLV
jgi:hypothetical protein